MTNNAAQETFRWTLRAAFVVFYCVIACLCRITTPRKLCLV